MPKIRYEVHNFRDATLDLIAQAVAICNEYAAQGLSLSLRQLYYQFVSRDFIPNSQKSYDRLGGIIANARLAGLIDWDILEDRGRSVTELSHWNDPQQILDAVRWSYRIDKWDDQDFYPLVLVEKDALSGVFDPVCQELDIPFAACKGYPSASFLWRIGRNRLRRVVLGSRQPIVFHFGDHDPSGIQMTEDLESRLSLFAERRVEVRRVALTIEQVQQYNPPPNPAKETDSRFESYRREFGDQSWELDALNPTILADLVRTQVMAIRDETRWQGAVDRENEEKTLLVKTAQRWDEVRDFLESLEDDEDAGQEGDGAEEDE